MVARPFVAASGAFAKCMTFFRVKAFFVPRLLKESDMKSWNTMKYHRIPGITAASYVQNQTKNAFTMASSSQTFFVQSFCRGAITVGGKQSEFEPKPQQTRKSQHVLEHCH